MSEDRPPPDFDKLLEFFQRIPVFGGVGRKALRLLYDHAEWRCYGEGELIVREGELGREMFVVLEGTARIHTGGRTLRQLCRGDCLGEMALIDIQPRSASVTASEPTELMVLGFDDLMRVYKLDLETYTLLVMNIAREISRRLRQANQLIESLGQPALHVQ